MQPNPDQWNILAVDDEPGILFSLEEICHEYSIDTFPDGQAALEALRNRTYQILIVDYKMPKMNGIELLTEAVRIPGVRYTILLTAFAEKDILQESINKNLVNRVLEKPLKSRELLGAVHQGIRFCQEAVAREQEIDFLKTSYQELKREDLLFPEQMIGINGGLKHIFSRIESVAQHPVSVLINGETGTGKEMTAKLIHSLSPQAEHNFVRINCAAIPDSLMESELFGHVKGAFTNAVQDKVGKIELANQGTLFLDEIADLKQDLQAKLLRVLQDKELSRVGSNQLIKVDFRLISATNRNLEDAIREGRFREDLYYRINTFPITLPPLRERLDDIPELTLYLADQIARELNIDPPEIDKGVFPYLRAYQWPGNIRELENAVKRVILVHQGVKRLLPEHFNFLDSSPQTGTLDHAVAVIRDTILTGELDLNGLEERVILSILDSFDGNIAQAVAHTGISKNRFYKYKSSLS